MTVEIGDRVPDVKPFRIGESGPKDSGTGLAALRAAGGVVRSAVALHP